MCAASHHGATAHISRQDCNVDGARMRPTRAATIRRTNMKAHRITAHAVALAAALALASLAAGPAGAQSDRRIPTRKGDVRTPVRTDTVVVRDTVHYRDTIVVRSDTVIRE